MWVLNIAAEAIVSAIFIQYWFPQVPIWILVLIISLVVTLINVCSVKMFAETEYWLASIKIAVIILFIIIGLTMLFVSFGQHAAPGLSNLTDHGGFFPNGTGGLIAAMLVVVYSYGGTEMIGVTLAETKTLKSHPKSHSKYICTNHRFLCTAVLHHRQLDSLESSKQ